MTPPYELRIGWRYTRARRRGGPRRDRFMSFIALIAMLGIALGVAALIVVVSVMNGFQRELRDRILAVVAHVEIRGENDRLTEWQAVAARAQAAAGVLAAAPYITEQAMLSFGDSVRGATVRGVAPAAESTVSRIGEQMLAGRLADLVAGEFGIVLGIELAQALGVRLGDRLTLIAPQGLVTPAGVVPRMKQFRVVGVFQAGTFEYDSGLALLHLEDARRLYRYGEAVSGVRLRLDDLFHAERASADLQARLGNAVKVTDWSATNASFFRAVRTEKTVMFVILCLIVAVAAFNIVSTLVMSVANKRGDIAILRTIGATPRSIQWIFIVQGAAIGAVGTLIGLAAGVLLAMNIGTVAAAVERLIGRSFFDPNVFYISNLPSELHRADVVTIAFIAFALTLAATILPSRRAAQVNPAEALSHE